MWLLFTRAPTPDARPWPGRHAFALLDAVAWPSAWAAFVIDLPMPSGLAGRWVLAICIFAALRRVHRAVVQNHRYHFTTWRWGRPIALMLAFGCALKLVAAFAV